jgi:hypothetical protein
MRRFLRDYGLGVVLAGLFIGSWILQTVSGWVEYVAQQEANGTSAQIFGTAGYFWPWMQATFENWQSEFLQLFSMAVLTAFLLHKGSTESKDGEAELRLQLAAIRLQLDALQGTKAAPKAAKGGSDDA